MAWISDKALKTQYAENKLRYNRGTELQNKEFNDGSGLDLYATNFRSLDPQLGRFWQIDPLLEISEDVSPYTYGIDNPILHVDPMGLMPDSLPPVTVTPKKSNKANTGIAGMAGLTIGKAVTDHPVARTNINTSIRFISAEEANVASGYKQPPYKNGTTVMRFKSSVLGRYVRVYNSKNPQSNFIGRWIVKRSEIEGLSGAQIKDKLALPEEPDMIGDVEVPLGEEIEASVAGPNDFGKGGGNQFKLLGKLVESWFKNAVPIQIPLPDVMVGDLFKTNGSKMPIEEIPPIEDIP